MAKPDRATQDRAVRLVDLRRELAVVAGFDPDNLSTDERMRTEHAAVLRLQHETLTARVIAGQGVDTGELIRLNEVVAALLPPAKSSSKPLQVKFVSPPDERLKRLSDEQLARLEEIAATLEGEPVPAGPEETEVAAAVRRRDEEIARLWKDQVARDARISEMARTIERLERQLDAPAVAPAAVSEPPKAVPARSGNVVPLQDDSASPWAALAMATNGAGGPPGVLFNAANPKGNLPEY